MSAGITMIAESAQSREFSISDRAAAASGSASAVIHTRAVSEIHVFAFLR